MNPKDPVETKTDYARLNTLKPVKQAIESLNLSPLRFRKLNGTLNALIMQIEDGGDFHEVNELLVKALRSAVIAQVGKESASTALDALTQFDQSEASRSHGKKSA